VITTGGLELTIVKQDQTRWTIRGQPGVNGATVQVAVGLKEQKRDLDIVIHLQMGDLLARPKCNLTPRRVPMSLVQLMVFGVHGESGVNVPFPVGEEKTPEIAYAIALHPPMEVLIV